MRLCCPKCCEGYSEDLLHCPKCGPINVGKTAASRDAVLAGVQRREWTDKDVEELARLLRVAPDEWRPELDKTWHIVKDMYVWQARAALAWFDRKRGEV